LEDYISLNKGLKPLACASYFYKMPKQKVIRKFGGHAM